MTNQTPEIKKRLLELYPCAEVPTGTWKAVAEEFGVTLQHVRQIAVSLGMVRVNQRKLPRVCKNCGATPEPHSKLCIDCSHPQVECSTCGKLFRRKAIFLRRSVNNPRYTTGQQFCSYRCFGANAGKAYGWGNADHPHRNVTHCKHGHPRIPSNLRGTLRSCRACGRLDVSARKQRQCCPTCGYSTKHADWCSHEG